MPTIASTITPAPSPPITGWDSPAKTTTAASDAQSRASGNRLGLRSE